MYFSGVHAPRLFGETGNDTSDLITEKLTMQRCCNCCGNSSSSRSKKDRIGRKQKSNGLLAALGSAVLVIGTIAILGGAHSAAAGLVPQSFALSGRTEGQARAYSNRGGSSFGGGEDGKRCLIAVPTVRGGATGEGSEDQDEEGAVGTNGRGSVGDEGGITKSVKGYFFKILGIVGRLLGLSTRGGRGGGGSNMLMGDSFKTVFEAKYGQTHPRFSEKSFTDATEQAWSRNRLCLVYIAAGRSGGKTGKIDDTICKALADPKVCAFVDSNFVMWVPGGKGKGKSKKHQAAVAAAAAKQVGARSLPFLGVVHSTSKTNKMTLERKLKRSTVALHHCNPPPNSKQMVSWMTRVLELQKGPLETERAEQQRLKDEDTIYTERVEGYSKSLKDDALREVREAQDEAERARLEEEERVAQAVREAKEKEDAERRAQKALDLGAEPADDGAPVSTLMLRLADGSRVRRRFLRSDVMGKVLDWADVQGVDLEVQRLSSSFPKVSFIFPGDCEVTIEEAGLGKQALLFVEQKPREEVTDPPASAEGNEEHEKELQ